MSRKRIYFKEPILAMLAKRSPDGVGFQEAADILGTNSNTIKHTFYALRKAGQAFSISLPSWARWYGTQAERDAAMPGARARRDRDVRISHAVYYAPKKRPAEQMMGELPERPKLCIVEAKVTYVTINGHKVKMTTGAPTQAGRQWGRE